LLAACGSPPPPAPLSQHVPPGPPSRCADTYSAADDAPIQLAYRISTTSMVERELVRHRGDFLRCGARDPGTRGTVSITFRMTSGKLQDVHTQGFDRAIDDCVCDVLFAIAFPHVDVSSITYPLYFTQ
jgi:hypothetical protein